jgi:predicted HD superfamily hydrolase involved in NAD metabolism
MCRAVRARLPEQRYRHVLGVARCAERLACRHGASPARARVAGVLHDCARHWDAEALLAYARGHDLSVSEHERAAPVLLHAKIGAGIARDEFGVSDPDTLAAIETHTVAVPGMSDLQKILFVADTIEPSRRFEGRAALETIALRSLDDGMLACLKASIDYLLARDVPIAPSSVEVYNTLVQRNGTTS